MATIEDLVKMMRENSDQLKDIKKEIQDSKSDIKIYVEEKLGKIIADVNQLEEKVSAQDERLSNIEKRLIEREIADKKRNLILYKVIEDEKTPNDLQETILKLLTENIDHTIAPTDIDFAFRIGGKKNEPRPIVIGFTTLTIKQAILKNKRNLTTKSIGLSEDLPDIIPQNRKRLSPIVKALFEKGYKVFLKYDKIIVNGEHWSEDKALQELGENKINFKRNGSPLSQAVNQKKKITITKNISFDRKKGPNSPLPKIQSPSMKNYILPSISTNTKNN